jgi:hypothetical protein
MKATNNTGVRRALSAALPASGRLLLQLVHGLARQDPRRCWR